MSIKARKLAVAQLQLRFIVAQAAFLIYSLAKSISVLHELWR